MHDIHWAVIFAAIPFWILVIGFLAWVVISDRRKPKGPQPKKIFNGDTVQVTLAAGPILTGTVSGVKADNFGGFTIICAPPGDPA